MRRREREEVDRVIKLNFIFQLMITAYGCVHQIAECAISAYHRPDPGIPPQSWSLDGELNG